MLLIIKFLGKIFAILNGEVSPVQIAAGFAYGVLLGLLPVAGLLPYVLLILAFILNINLAIMFVSAAVCKLIAFATDPITNQIGFRILAKTPEAKALFTRLYNMPLVPYTRFNNTIVMGSLVLGILLLLPMYLFGRWGVVTYRERWRERILRTRVMQIIKASSFYKYYESYRSWRGE